MSFFHIDYKPITDKLPKSLVKRSYDRLLCLKHNPITLNQISEKHNRIETYLRHILKIYEQGKARSRKVQPSIDNTMSFSVNQLPADTSSTTNIDNKTSSEEQGTRCLENLYQTITNQIRLENNIYLENESHRLQTEYKQYIDNYNNELRILKQRLENQYTIKMQNIKSQESALLKSLEIKDKEIDKLTLSITLSKNDIREIKDALKSAEVSINKLEKEKHQLLDIILAKDKKIIALNDKIISYCPRGLGDGSIEPEYFYSTYDQELWAKWHNEAKYDPEIRKKFTFRKHT